MTTPEPTNPPPSPPTDQPAQAPPATGASIARLTRALARLRWLVVAHLLAARVLGVMGLVVALGLVFALVDYVLRWPTSVRLVFWCVNAGALGWWFARFLLPVLRFRPTDTQLALRIEQTELGLRSGWRGLLASGLELSRRPDAGEGLTHDAVARAAESFARVPSRRLLGALHAPVLARSTAIAAIALIAMVSIATIHPVLTGIGARRVLMPWSGAQWPKRTAIAHAELPAAHPLGVALPLRAVLLRSPGPAERANVEATYRVIADGVPGPRVRTLLTPQARRAVAHGVSDTTDGASTMGTLFERLIDPQALLASLGTTPDAGASIQLEYSFASADDQTPVHTVALVEPPRATAITLDVTPPAYVAGLPFATDVLAGRIDAGTGLDDRAAVGPVLAGSTVAATIRFNKPLPAPPSSADQALLDAFLRARLPGLLPDQSATPQAPASALTLVPSESLDAWTLTLPAERSLRVSILPVDRFQLGPRDEATLRLEVVEDRTPTAAIIAPAQDEAVLPSAVIPTTAEGRDDVAVWTTTLLQQVAKGDSSSPGAVPVPQGEPAPIATRNIQSAEASPAAPASAAAARTLQASSTIDLAPLALTPGDELRLTAQAQDAKGALAQPPTAPVVSAVRRLRIISESQLVEQLRTEMAGVRDAAQRLEQEQSSLTAQRGLEGEALSQAQRAQAGLAERVEPLAQALERLAQRADRNRLEDAALQGALSDARQAASTAAQAAQQAAERLSAAGEAARAEDRAAQDAQAQQAQQQAADELAALAQSLSTGDDDWSVRRALEQLLTQQRQLRAQTAAAGAQTQGQDVEQLPRAQRDDLERIARRQEELAEQASRTLEELERRAREAQEASPERARSLEQAAARARAQQLTQRQRDAARQARQNQTGQSQQSQQAAEQALQEALDAMEQTQQAQDQRLRRLLADVQQSLRQLIEQQEAQLALLAPALQGQAAPNLDQGMIALHQNTLGVVGTLREQTEQSQSLERLAGLVSSAGESQAGAIVSLRQAPPDLVVADQMERTSLARLQEALAEAQRLDQQAQRRDEQRVRRELRKAYTQALDVQTGVNAQARELAGAEDNRRTRSQARALSQRQEELRQRLSELRSKTTELADAKVFDFAHNRLERDMATAIAGLGEGRVAPATLRQLTAAARVLASLVKALEDPPKSDDLQDSGGGGGGGGGGGQQGQQDAIPDFAQLVLLREMQAEALARTEALGQGQDVDASEAADVSRLQQDLAAQAQALLEKLQQQDAPQGQPLPPVAPGDGPDRAPQGPRDQEPAP